MKKLSQRNVELLEMARSLENRVDQFCKQPNNVCSRNLFPVSKVFSVQSALPPHCPALFVVYLNFCIVALL